MSRTTTQTQTLNHPNSAPRQVFTTTTAAAAAASPAPSIPTPQLANFNYYLPPANRSPDTKPSTDDLELILGTKNQDTRRLPVHDLRDRFDAFELDRCGFEVVVLDGKQVLAGAKGWEDDEWIRCLYYPVMEGVVRRL
jgi:hypothetical protein